MPNAASPTMTARAGARARSGRVAAGGSAVVVVAQANLAGLLGDVGLVGLQRQFIELGLVGLVLVGHDFLVLFDHVWYWLVKFSLGHGDPRLDFWSSPRRRGISHHRTYCRMARVEQRWLCRFPICWGKETTCAACGRAGSPSGWS